MKPHLVIGLGNGLMGDDGIGLRVARDLSGDAKLEEFEICEGGTDLLREQGRFAGRRSIALIDGSIDDLEPGTVTVLSGDDLPVFSQRHMHHLCLLECLSLVRYLQPQLDRIPITLFLISVPGAELSFELSPVLSPRLPFILDEIRSRLIRDGRVV